MLSSPFVSSAVAVTAGSQLICEQLLETVGAGGRKEVDEQPACLGGATEVLAASRTRSTLSI